MPDKIPHQPKLPRQLPKRTREQLLASKRQFNRTGTEFLKVDAVTGLTFAKAALDSRDEEKKLRNQKSARKAYDTIVRMLNKITPSDADAQQLHESLHQLKNQLIQLGEPF